MKRWVYRRPADVAGRGRRVIAQSGQPQPPVPFPKKRQKHQWIWPDREISEVYYWRRQRQKRLPQTGQPQPSVPFPLRRPRWLWWQPEFPYWVCLRRPHFTQGAAAPQAQFFPPFKKRDAQLWRYRAEALTFAKRPKLTVGGEPQPPIPFPKKRQKHQWLWPDVEYPVTFYWRRKKFTAGGEPQPPVPFPYNKRKNRWAWPEREYPEQLYYKRRRLTEQAQVAPPAFLFKKRRDWPQLGEPLSPVFSQKRRALPRGGEPQPPRPFPFRRKGWIWWEKEYPFATYQSRKPRITEGVVPAAPSFFPPFKRRPQGEWIFRQEWTLIQKRPKFPLSTPAAPPAFPFAGRKDNPASLWDKEAAWPVKRRKLLPKSPDFFFRPSQKRRGDARAWALEVPWQLYQRRPKRLPQTPPSPLFPPFRRRDAIGTTAVWAPKPQHPWEQYLRRRRFTPGSPIITPTIFGATGIGALDPAAGLGVLDEAEGTGLFDKAEGQGEFDKSEGAGGLDAAYGEGNLN